MNKSKSERIRELRIKKAELLKELNEINKKIEELKIISQGIKTFNNNNIAKDNNSSTNPEISEEEPEL